MVETEVNETSISHIVINLIFVEAKINESQVINLAFVIRVKISLSKRRCNLSIRLTFDFVNFSYVQLTWSYGIPNSYLWWVRTMESDELIIYMQLFPVT